MRLSEAMKKGYEIFPHQCTGSYFQYQKADGKDEPVAACALGMALIGYVGLDEAFKAFIYNQHQNTLKENLPEDENIWLLDSPLNSEFSLNQQVIHWNDEMRFTPLEIATKLEEKGL